MEQYNFNKSTCERYDIRLQDKYGWAIITIDKNGGIFNAQSDYGDYSYRWPYHGRKSFKHFILELVRDKSYFLGKVANDKYYYSDETEKAWKEKILRARREGDLNQDEARELWEEVTGFDFYTSAEHIQYQCYESEIVSKYYYDDAFDIVQGFSPQAHAFADIIMPIFGEIIKNEISRSEKIA